MARYDRDAIDYAGSIRLYLHNGGGEPLTVEAIDLDGAPVGKVWRTDASFLDPAVRDAYIEVVNDQLAWYRVYPNPIAPGAQCEIILRLTPPATETDEHHVAVRLSDGRRIETTLSATANNTRLDYVGFTDDLAGAHVYIESDNAPEPIEVDGRPIATTLHHVADRLWYAKLQFDSPLRVGSYHTIAAGAAGARDAVMIRALANPAPLGIFGNISEAQCEQYADHLFETNIAFMPQLPETYDRLERFGLRGSYIYWRKDKPDEQKFEPVYYDRLETIEPFREHDGLWAYFLEDEPDGRYHRTTLPRIAISRDVERANQFLRIADPVHPTYLQIDHGGYPRNMYIFGQITDHLTTHAYRMGSAEVVTSTADHTIHTRQGHRPRPFYYLCSGYCTGRGVERVIDPREMELEVFAALREGAKSLQWYPAHSANGLLKHPAIWDAVGRMNVILHQVLPLVSIGTPIGEARIEGGGRVSGKMILCGDRAVVVVLVNEDFEATPDSFSITPARVKVRVDVPALISARGVAMPRVATGPLDLPAKIDGPQVEFEWTVDAGAVVVIYGEESVFEQLRQSQAKWYAQFKPMEASE